jgi:hypothetical protein
VSPTTGVEFRGGKGDLYEGGLRIPAVARWPGRIAPGRTSDHVWYQPDILPTLAELAGAEVPEGVDGLSILPELLGEEVVGRKQERHEALYWEYRGQTAVRMGRWKAVRPAPEQPWELYDLEEDVSETESVALREPDRLREMTAFAEASHTPVVPGTYADRTAHEKDRWAKWGLAPRPGIAWPVPERALPREGRIRPQSFRVVSASSETRGEGPARYAFDDDPRTAWRASGVPGSGPQDLVIDLGDEYLVRGFHLLAPADEDPGGSVERCAFFVSNDPTSFGDAVADVDLRAVETPQSVAATPRTGRFVRLRVLSTFDATPEVALAELGVQGERPPARGGMDPTRRPPR